MLTDKTENSVQISLILVEQLQLQRANLCLLLLTLAWLLAPLSGGYVGYCDANVARQPNQVTRVLSEHSSQLGWFDLPTLSFILAAALAQAPSNSKLKYASLCSWESIFTHVFLLLPLCLANAAPLCLSLSLSLSLSPALHCYITLADQFMSACGALLHQANAS